MLQEEKTAFLRSIPEKEDGFKVTTPARIVALLGIVIMFLATILYAGSKLKIIR